MLKKKNRLRSTLLLVACFGLCASRVSAFTFSTPVFVNASNPQNAAEPGIAVDSLGRIFINAPQGLIGPSQIWRSENGGSSWLQVNPKTVGATPTPTVNVTVGGGDANLAIDGKDNLYFVDLWLLNSSAAVSHNHGANWTGLPIGNLIFGQDRPWVSADPRPGQLGKVYFLTEQPGTGLFITETLPLPFLEGAVFPIAIPEITDAQRGIIGFASSGNIVTNGKGDTYNAYSLAGTPPKNPNNAGIGVSVLPSGQFVVINRDVTAADNAHDQTQALPVIAVDKAIDNNLYLVWTDPVSASQWNIRFASSSDGGKTWSNAVTLGNGVYPWVTADAAGKVDVVWYSAAPTYIGDPNNAPAGSHWDVFFSQSTNALASTATFSSPTDVAAAKTGQICTKGTGCTANRELLDFFSITRDAGGDALISYANVPKPGTAHVMFTRQTAGPLIN